MSTLALRLTRSLPADVHTVFAAWSSADALSRWFVVRPHWTARVECDFRVGGSYRIEMDKQDGTVGVAFGEYVEIDPPRRLVFTWNAALPEVQNTRVTVELRATGTGTELTLTHELLPDTRRGRNHGTGWEGCLASLVRYLQNPSM